MAMHFQKPFHSKVCHATISLIDILPGLSLLLRVVVSNSTVGSVVDGVLLDAVV